LYKWSGYYPKYFGDYFNDENATHVHNIHAHNDFLELFAESGVFAVLVFLLIYLSVIYSLLGKIKSNEKYFPLLLTFLVTSAYSLVAFPNHKFSSSFLALVVAGTTLIVDKDKAKNLFNLKLRNLKWILAGLLILGGITSYIKLRSELNYRESIFFKERKEYSLMLNKLDLVSDIFYPFDGSKQPVDYYRGIANYYLRNYKENLNIVLHAGELAPYNPIILNNIGAAYEAMNDFERAIKNLEKVKIYFPNYIKPQFNLLRLYHSTGKKDKANLLLEELITKFPDNSSLLKFKNRVQ